MNYTDVQYPVAAGRINVGCPVAPKGLPNGDIGLFYGFLPWGPTGNPFATPLFSVPGDVTLVDPLWKTCKVMSSGIWDPPRKLVKQTAMVPAAATLSQQLTAAPRIPISAPYGPATTVPSVEDPNAGAPRLLLSIPSGKADPKSGTLDSSADVSDPPGDARSSEDHSNNDPAPDAPSATTPSTQIHRSGPGTEGSASNLVATPVVHIQSPAPGLSPGPKLSVQPDVEDTRFALSLVTPVLTSHSATVGDQFLAANPDIISPSDPTVISDHNGIDIAGTPVELHTLSQLAIDESTLVHSKSTLPLVHTIPDPLFSAEPMGFAIAVGGGSFSPGEALVTISGTAAALGSGTLQTGKNAIPLPAAPSKIFTIGKQILTAKSDAIYIEGERITRAGWGTTIDRTQVSLGSSDLLIVGSSAISLSADQALPTVFTVGGKVFTPNPTVTADGSGATIAGTQVSLGSSGLLIVGSSTISLLADQPLPTVFTVGSEVFTPNPTAISMDGITITPDGSGVTIAGTRVSLRSSGLLIVGSSTISLLANQPLPTVFTVGSEVFTPNPTAISMDGITITAGGPGVAIAGIQVSLGSSGRLVVGSSTMSFLADQALPTVFTVGSEALTPNPTAISMDGTTITAGGPGITIAGTPVDLQASGTLVVGNSTFAVIPTDLTTSATSLIFEGQGLGKRRNILFGGVYVVTICIVLAAL